MASRKTSSLKGAWLAKKWFASQMLDLFGCVRVVSERDAWLPPIRVENPGLIHADPACASAPRSTDFPSTHSAESKSAVSCSGSPCATTICACFHGRAWCHQARQPHHRPRLLQRTLKSGYERMIGPDIAALTPSPAWRCSPATSRTSSGVPVRRV